MFFKYILFALKGPQIYLKYVCIYNKIQVLIRQLGKDAGESKKLIWIFFIITSFLSLWIGEERGNDATVMKPEEFYRGRADRKDKNA